jgi:protein associated with RNAse G/E
MIAAPRTITVRVLKYDGIEYRRWNARLARHEDSLLVLDAEFEDDVQHHLLGGIQRGTRTVEYYWLDCWYNIFRFLNEDGQTRLFYCNVNMPPTFEGDTLTYIDLDIDILMQPDFSYQVVDLEEFEANAARYGYPEKLKTQAREAVDELVSMIASRQFPFDEKV